MTRSVDPEGLDELALLLDEAAADEAVARADAAALPPGSVSTDARAVLSALWAREEGAAGRAGAARGADDARGAGDARASGAAHATEGAARADATRVGSTDAVAASRPGTRNRVPPRGARPWVRVSAAAAILLLAALWFVRQREAPLPEDGVLLGGAPWTILEPAAGFERIERVRWSAPVGAEGWTFVVRVQHAASGGASVLHESARLDARSWTPPRDEVTTWPPDIEVHVLAWDAAGQPAGRSSVSARSSSGR